MIKYGLLTASDEMASEDEVYDFLYALVRLLKPKVILETGTYKGGATAVMARAIQENGIGDICTCDTDMEMIYHASQTVQMATDGSLRDVQFICNTGVELCKDLPDVDLAYIDSSGDRVEEVRNLQLTPNAVVVLHDSKRPQYRPIWTLKPWKSVWEIDTIQGVAVFQL